MSLKIAILSDIHGNLTALKAVTKDIIKQKVDEVWVLGDYFFPGPNSTQILRCLETLPVSIYMRGNWEDVFSYTVKGGLDWNRPFNVYASILANHLSQDLSKEDYEFVTKLPDHVITERERIRFSLNHNAPKKNFGHDLLPQSPQDNFDMLIDDSMDVAIYAHVHHPMLRYSNSDQIILNTGSVGQPFNRYQYSPKAQYLLLEIKEGVLDTINFKRVEYNVDKEIEMAKDMKVPYLEAYITLLKTGVAATHDHEYLTKVQDEHNHKQSQKEVEAKLREKYGK